jgi:hypothetical protein
MNDDLVNDPDFIELRAALKKMSPDRQEAFQDMMQEKVKEEIKPEMVTPDQFAARVGVSTQSVRRWLRNGLIKGRKIGPRKWFIHISEADKILRAD